MAKKGQKLQIENALSLRNGDESGPMVRIRRFYHDVALNGVNCKVFDLARGGRQPKFSNPSSNALRRYSENEAKTFVLSVEQKIAETWGWTVSIKVSV